MMKIETNDKHEKHGYKVPENYFEQSKKEMLSQLYEEENRENKYIYLLKKTWKPLAIAASLALIVTLTIPGSLKNNVISDEDYQALFIESINIEEEDFDDWYVEKYVLENN